MLSDKKGISNAKEIINKRVINQIRTVGKSMSFPKLISFGLVSLLDMLPLSSLPNRGIMAYAQLEPQQQAQAIDAWSEALRTAQAKVEAAISPILTTSDLLLVFGVAAVGSILMYVIANHLLNRSKEKMEFDQLIVSSA